MAQPPQSAAGLQGGAGAPPVPAVEPPLPQLAPVSPVQAAPAPQTPAAVPQTTPAAAMPTATPSASATPPMAADNDVIEPEWIHKVKQIVATTQGDPYQQVMQLNQLKADYMQKRYNKTVKLPDA